MGLYVNKYTGEVVRYSDNIGTYRQQTNMINLAWNYSYPTSAPNLEYMTYSTSGYYTQTYPVINTLPFTPLFTEIEYED